MWDEDLDSRGWHFVVELREEIENTVMTFDRLLHNKSMENDKKKPRSDKKPKPRKGVDL
jgi:hypothetical protein